MGVKIVKGRVLPIGVDLGTSAVKMAQLRVAKDSYELVAAGSADVPGDCRQDLHQRLSFFGAAIRRLLRTNGFRSRECILSIPAACTFVHHVRIPKVSPEKVHRSVLQELQGKLPFAASEAEIRHVVAGDVLSEGEARQEIIVVAASRRDVQAHLAMARRAKLDVAGISVEPCAIVECFGRLFRRASDQERTILFVDLGQASTQVVLSHGSRIAFARNLGIGGDHLDEAIAKKLKIPLARAAQVRRALAANSPDDPAEEVQEAYGLLAEPLDELAHELTQCLRYYESVFHHQGIERAIFLGGEAHDKRLCQTIAQRLNLPAQIGDPLVRVGGTPTGVAPTGGGDAGLDRREPQPRWAVAVGLSLSGMQAA